MVLVAADLLPLFSRLDNLSHIIVSRTWHELAIIVLVLYTLEASRAQDAPFLQTSPWSEALCLSALVANYTFFGTCRSALIISGIHVGR